MLLCCGYLYLFLPSSLCFARKLIFIFFLWVAAVPHPLRFPYFLQTLVKQLPTQDSAAMMLLGSLAAECASTGLQWVYDQEQLQRKAASHSLPDLMFYDPPQCPFFTYPVGNQGFYHEQVQSFRRCLVQVGAVSEADQAKAYTAYYQHTVEGGERVNAAEITEKYIDRLTKTFVANQKDGKNWSDCGINQFEAQSLCKVPTLVARYCSDTPTLLQEVKKMVRIWQVEEGCAVATLFCTLTARLLEHTLRTRCLPSEALMYYFECARSQPPSQGRCDNEHSLTKGEIQILQSLEVLESQLLHKIQDIEAVLAFNTEASDRQKQRIQTVMTRALFLGGTGDGSETHYRNVIAGVNLEPADKDMWLACKALAKEAKWAPPRREKLPDLVTAKLLGISCDVHGVFFNVCYLLQTCSSYQEAVQRNVLLGGDCCSRAVVLGAFFAAPVYPLAPEKELLLYCPSVEQSRPLQGGEMEDQVSVLRAAESWIPCDWLGKCDSSALAEVVNDAEVLAVARSEVLVIGGGTSRFAHAINAVLASGEGQPSVRVVNLSLSAPAKFSQHIHANTRSILLMGGEVSEDPTPIMLAALQALEECKTNAHVVLMSSTAADLSDTLLGKHFSVLERHLESSALTGTSVRTPWMMEHVFDQTKKVRQGGHLSMFLPPATQFASVSMRDVSRAVSRMLLDPISFSSARTLTFTGPLLCMQDVAAALSEVVGKPVEYHQVDSCQAYLETVTTKNSVSKFEVNALMEICKIIEKNSKNQIEGYATDTERSEVDNFGVVYDPRRPGDLVDILQRAGRFHRIFGDQGQPALSSVRDAMQELPPLKLEEKRGEQTDG